MGVSRMRAVRRYKKRELEKVLKLIVSPVVIGTKILSNNKRKKRSKRK